MARAVVAAALVFAPSAHAVTIDGHRMGPLHTVRGSTAYCSPQLDALGGRARFGIVAVPQHGPRARLFKRLIWLKGGMANPYGRRRHWFRANDRIGHSSPLDFFRPWHTEPHCGWGRRTVRFRVAL